MRIYHGLYNGSLSKRRATSEVMEIQVLLQSGHFIEVLSDIYKARLTVVVYSLGNRHSHHFFLNRKTV